MDLILLLVFVLAVPLAAADFLLSTVQVRAVVILILFLACVLVVLILLLAVLVLSLLNLAQI